MSLGELKICKQHGEVKPNIHGNCSFCGNKVEVTKCEHKKCEHNTFPCFSSGACKLEPK